MNFTRMRTAVACGLIALAGLSPALTGPAAAAAALVQERESFDDWRADFRARLAAEGIDAAILASMLDGLSPDPVVLERDAFQPEFVRPVWEYLQGAVSDQRVSAGLEAQAREAESLAVIEQRYGVDKDVLTAIWGLESAYGRIMGDFDLVQALATLAWDGRRRAFAEGQLRAMAQMIARGYATREQLRGSWAGGMGQTQFIPTTYMDRAVDFDGDGRRDVWGSAPDALASAANLLAEAGWERGGPTVEQVILDPAFDMTGWTERTRRTVADWEASGVRAASGAFAAENRSRQARIVMPAGGAGPAFLAYENFEAILQYNYSTSYGLAVSYLAKRLEGTGALPGGWPVDNPPLSVTHARDLQAALTALGFDTQGVDGRVGPNTRAALRRFQAERGHEADGYAGRQAYIQVIGIAPADETPR